MIATSADTLRVPRRSPRPVRLVITFTPGDPIGATDVDLVGDDTPSAWRYYQLVAAAARRLTVYACDFRAAAEDDQEVTE